MTRLYLFDDLHARTFEPFALTRPVSELCTGAMVIRQRWERVAGMRASGALCAPHLADFEEFDAPPVADPYMVLPAGAIIVHARFAVALDEILTTTDHVWTCDGAVCAVRLAHDLRASEFADGTLTLDAIAPPHPHRRVHGRWITELWDCIAQLGTQLMEDITALASSVDVSSLMYDAQGDHPVTVEEGATIEPFVLFDTRTGPILIRRGAVVPAFTRVTGPCYIGENVTILGDRVAVCSLGDWSKIHGEISNTIVLGHSNKGHTGFVGHSYLGRWVNLGAGTTTSNLKNTYGTVQLWTPRGVRDTGQQFLGTFFGDHTKTGIGTMLNTGTVLSVGANVYGASMPPKYVPPFAWGEGQPYQTFACEKFLSVAEHVMQRRHVAITDRQRKLLASIHAQRTA